MDPCTTKACLSSSSFDIDPYDDGYLVDLAQLSASMSLVAAAKERLYSNGTKPLETIEELITVVGKENIDLAKIKDPETYTVVCVHFNKVPSAENPENLLRFILVKATGSPVLIKNKEVVKRLHESNHNIQEVNDLLVEYAVSLSTVFHRFKPLFLALRRLHRAQINRIARLAKHNKQRKTTLPLDDIKHHSFSAIVATLNHATTNTLLKVYKHMMPPKLYFIRNGSMWCDSSYGDKYVAIVNALRVRLSCRIFRIERHVDPAIPTSEKLFAGDYPVGTAITVQLPFSLTTTSVDRHGPFRLNLLCIEPYNNSSSIAYAPTVHIPYPVITPKIIVCHMHQQQQQQPPATSCIEAQLVLSRPYKVVPFQMTTVQKVIGIVYPPDRFILIDRHFGGLPSYVGLALPLYKVLLSSCQPQKTMRSMAFELGVPIEEVDDCIRKSEYNKMLR